MKYKGEIIAIAVIILFAAMFLLVNANIQKNLGEDEEAWAGADSSAAQIIEESGYTPWFSPIWEPPSGEIETFFFSLQAAIGALIIGYFFGYYRGRQQIGQKN